MLVRLLKIVSLIAFLVVCAAIVFVLEQPSAFAPASDRRNTDALDAYVFTLADTNQDGSLSDLESLTVMLDVSTALDASYPSVKRYDLDGDGDVDANDAAVIGEVIDRLAF